ncbi:RsbRD N-terminal domain-containing protein [Chloroflexota bacterium]
MNLENSLAKKKAAILDKWLKVILESYPDATSRFLKQEKDRFANPAGYTISQDIETIYEELFQETNSEKLAACLDNIIRIRSVQDFPPSEAIAFTFFLKKAIREELVGEIADRQIFEELLKFESRIDDMILLSLDIYMKCREKIYQIRVNEANNEKEMALKLLERMSSA